MTRNDFSLLLQKYLDGRCSETEQRMVESWFALLDDEKRWQSMPKEEIKAIEQRLWNRLQQSLHPADAQSKTPVPEKKIFRLPSAWKAAAAVLFLIIGAAVFFQFKKGKTVIAQPEANNWVRKSNETTKPLVLVLEDGSSLQMAADATVYYPAKFSADKRELWIEGTAFFKIAKDSARPFYVHSRDIVTRVLGTSFWVVYNKERQQSAVEVVSGRVAVYKESADEKEVHAEGVLLKPNEKVIFNKKEEVLITALVDVPVPVNTDSLESVARKTVFVYEETPLSAVVRDMENEYGISIILGDEKLSALQFTGDISTLDYYTKLKTICRSLGTAYEVKGNRILIQR